MLQKRLVFSQAIRLSRLQTLTNHSTSITTRPLVNTFGAINISVLQNNNFYSSFRLLSFSIFRLKPTFIKTTSHSASKQVDTLPPNKRSLCLQATGHFGFKQLAAPTPKTDHFASNNWLFWLEATGELPPNNWPLCKQRTDCSASKQLAATLQNY